MKVSKDFTTVHPVLIESCLKIQKDIIEKHSFPMRLFELGRTKDRHQALITKGRTKDILSRHLYNLENDPPLYCTAVDYVFYNGAWSWNLRNAVILSWYNLFGYLVLESCPELTWGGLNRRSSNFNHFELRRDIIVDNLDDYPCVVP
jgi:hypothetical protein